jgi:hypothetical protein
MRGVRAVDYSSRGEGVPAPGTDPTLAEMGVAPVTREQGSYPGGPRLAVEKRGASAWAVGVGGW